MTILVVPTPFRRREAYTFCHSILVTEALLRCRVVVVAKPKKVVACPALLKGFDIHFCLHIYIRHDLELGGEIFM